MTKLQQLTFTLALGFLEIQAEGNSASYIIVVSRRRKQVRITGKIKLFQTVSSKINISMKLYTRRLGIILKSH